MFGRERKRGESGPQQPKNPFAEAGSAFNDALLSGKYNPDQLLSSINAAIGNVQAGLQPNQENALRLRQNLIASLAGQAAFQAAQHSDDRVGQFNQIHDRFHALAQGLPGPEVPAAISVPSAQQMSGVKA